jgi:succinyl-diaminopimelate desuccinylase
VIQGLSFYEVVTITQLHAGIADNVVPGEAVAHVNLRYPPDRSPEDAEAYLRSLVPAEATFEFVGSSPPARVVADAPLVRALREAGGFELQPKQAWTNVADFTSRGIDAVNLGPGGTRWAHARDEQVEIAALVRVFEALWRFLTGP